MDGRVDWWTDERTDGQRDGRADGRTTDGTNGRTTDGLMKEGERGNCLSTGDWRNGVLQLTKFVFLYSLERNSEGLSNRRVKTAETKRNVH